MSPGPSTTRSIPEAGERLPGRGSAIAFTVAAVAIGLLLTVVQVRALGSASGLLSVGPHAPGYPLVHDEIPHLRTAVGRGHDGVYFYAIARHPFAFSRTARILVVPTFRYRRILFPLLAGRLAPGGGLGLVYAMVLVSLAGVALGAWSLARLPGAPRWLSLMAILNPGVIAALFYSLSDALATGLVLAAFATMSRRRVAATVAWLVLAAFTRETAVLAALALACWPGLRTRDRVAVAGLPVASLAAWSAYVAARTHSSSFAQPNGGALTWPLGGWIHGGGTSGNLMIELALVGVLLLALVRWRGWPAPVPLFVLANLVLLVCASTAVTSWWYDATRVASAAFPLAVWMIVGSPDAFATAGGGRLAAPTGAPRDPVAP